MTKLYIGMGLLLLATIVIAIGVSSDAQARTCVWDGDDAGALASTDANWDLDTAPIAGDDIVFDGSAGGTSDDSCTWDLATNSFGNFTILATYGGTVTQSSDMYITRYSQAGGTFTGSTTKWVYCSGNIVKSGGVWTLWTISFRLSTDSTSISISNTDSTLYRLNASANIQYINSHSETNTIRNSLQVLPGKTLTFTNGVVLQTHSGFSNSLLNSGNIVIASGKTMYINCHSDVTINFGAISGGTVYVGLYDGTSASRTFTLGSTLNINSILIVAGWPSGGSSILTFNLAGYSLSSTSLTVGTRGIVSSTVAGASVTATGAVTVSANGQLDATHIATINCGGNWNPSAGTWKPGSSRVTMTATGTSTMAAGQWFYDLYINNGVTRTLASATVVQHHKEIAGTLVQAGYNVIINGSYAIPLSINGTHNGNIYVNTSATNPVVYTQPSMGSYVLRAGDFVLRITGGYDIEVDGDAGILSIKVLQWSAAGYQFKASSSVTTANYTFTCRTLVAKDWLDVYRDNIFLDTYYSVDGWIDVYENGTWSEHTYTISEYAGSVLPSTSEVDYSLLIMVAVILALITLVGVFERKVLIFAGLMWIVVSVLFLFDVDSMLMVVGAGMGMFISAIGFGEWM
jgi:hypothetical protein